VSDDYNPPIDDIRFAFDHLAGLEDVLRLEHFSWLDRESVDGVMDEAARFAAEVIAPLNAIGDKQGSVRNEDGTVTTPEGFDKAYRQYVEAGWPGVTFDEAFGGGGFPQLVGTAIQELATTASMAFSLCPLLTYGAVDMLWQHGSEAQKELYLPKLVSGEWTGTMNLTEPHAGSDVGALSTKAVPQDDGTYRLTGTKIFITFGEHSLTENIIHLVLARTPDAPVGTRGISCFIVPKFLVTEDGGLGDRNDVTCVSLEHKLGIHASPTCVLSFGDNGGAVGYLIGEENAGMRYMFTMMNNARLSVGVEGLSISERAYQQAVAYAAERVQGRPVDGERGDAIIGHPDVRRMLLTMRSTIEAMRGLLYLNAAAVDRSHHESDPVARAAGDDLAQLLTPISKAWSTDMGVELTSLAVQIYGGMGFIEEAGVAQHYRDARIAPIYEGTNGIQALDLVGRKLPLGGGAAAAGLVDRIETVARELMAAGDRLEPIGASLAEGVESLRRSLAWFSGSSAIDGMAGATPLLAQFGTVIGGWMHGQSALAARALLDGEGGGYQRGYLEAKLVTAAFYAEQILPRALSHERAACAGSATIMAPTPAQLGA
jgi:3-(methylthio)propanoyl-CoA dehydrogenase